MVSADFHLSLYIPGYGGIPYGDENDEITLTTCTPIKAANETDMSTIQKVQWLTYTEE